MGHGILCKEIRKGGIDPHIYQVPVIQSRPLYSGGRNVKAQGLDQMEHCARGGAGAGDVSRVLGNLRFD